jgi:hypothetical protein
MFLHYSDIVIDFDPNRVYKYRGPGKPGGLWFTDTTENNWSWWCKNEEFHLGSIEHQIVFKPEIRLLTLQSEQEVKDFSEKYDVKSTSLRLKSFDIDWDNVTEKYDAIYITPYFWSLRHELLWYYGWDCASGVIWNLDMVQSVTPTKE